MTAIPARPKSLDAAFAPHRDEPGTALPIVCETPECRRRAKQINIAFIASDDVEVFIESYGRGSEDPKADICRECGVLGVLKTPSDSTPNE